LFGYGLKDGVCVVDLLMDLFKVIKFDWLIPLPALMKRCSQDGITFEKVFEVICWGWIEETLEPF